jgi:gluconolactonase
VISQTLSSWSGAGELKLFRASANPNGNFLDLEGRILTYRHGPRDIVRTELDGELTVHYSRFENKLLNSPNDVAIKSDGTIWFTDPSLGLPHQTEGTE